MSRIGRRLTRGSVGALLVVAALVVAALVGSAGSTAVAAPTKSADRPGYPVTVQSCGQPVTFTAPPRRAVSNDINLTEDMVALGLANRMVGTFGVSDPMPARYRAAYNRVRHVSSGYVKLEPLVALHPDFLFAGWNYGLTQGSNLTPASLARFGIKTYVLEESCAHVQPAKPTVSIDDTYTDLRNLGAIFGVPGRANTLIAAMSTQIASVRQHLADTSPTPVFLYDSGTAFRRSPPPDWRSRTTSSPRPVGPTCSRTCASRGRASRGSRSSPASRPASSSTTTGPPPRPRSSGSSRPRRSPRTCPQSASAASSPSATTS